MTSSFVENKGQLDNEKVLFYTRGDPLSVGFKTDGLVFTLYEEDRRIEVDGIPYKERERRASVFYLDFKGCNDVVPRGLEPMHSPSHFYIGNDPSKWVRGAESYREVLYKEVYDWIDIRFLFKEDRLKYEFIVHEGGDPDVIECMYRGIAGLSVEDSSGDLLIDVGPSIIRDDAPYIYPTLGDPYPPDVNYRMIDDHSYGYSIEGVYSGEYPFIIDPGLELATYLGGSRFEMGGFGQFENGSYICYGTTYSDDFPTMPGNHSLAGVCDGFIVFMDPFLSQINSSLFIGGSSYDNVGLAGDGPTEGELVFVGHTTSKDFPTVNTLNKSLHGPLDTIIFSIQMTDHELLFSTYLGGNGYDMVMNLQHNPQGEFICIATTNSSDLPMSHEGYCQTYVQTYEPGNERCDSIWIGKFDPTLRHFNYCTYFNGINYSRMIFENRTTVSSSLDPDGNIYIVGSTTYPHFNTTNGAYMETHQGRNDAFAIKFDPNGTRLLASTFIGTEHLDQAMACVYENDELYIGGVTGSGNFPTTIGAWDRRYDSDADGFLMVMDDRLSRPTYSTYIGGGRYDSVCGIGVDPNNDDVTILLATMSKNLPCEPPGVFDIEPIEEDEFDNYFMVRDIKTGEIKYSTYYCAVGRKTAPVGRVYTHLGKLIISQSTTSDDLITTEGVYQPKRAGDRDIHVSVFNLTLCDPPFAPENLVVSPEVSSVNLTWDTPKFNGARITHYTVHRETSDGGSVATFEVDDPFNSFIDHSITEGTTYTYWVTANNSAGQGLGSERFTVWPLGLPSPPTDITVSSGDGNVTITWSPPTDVGGGSLRGYYLERGLSLSNMVPLTGGALSSGQTNFTDWNVTLGQRYFYRIRAFNEQHNGTSSIAIPIIATRPPDAPRDFGITEGDEEVLLRWSAPASDGGAAIIEYRVYQGTDIDNIRFIGTTDRDDRVRRVTTLVNGQDYLFYVTTFTEVGEGPPTEILTANPYGVPQEPSYVTATMGDSEVTLTWESPMDDGGREILGYTVYKKGPMDADFERCVFNLSATGFVVLDLVNGEEYFFEVAALNLRGEGIRSGTLSAIPMTIPSEPWDLHAVSVPTGIQLLWNAPNSTGGASTLSYIILKGTDTKKLDRLDNVTTQEIFIDERTKAGVTYYYRVIAVNVAGEGPWSNQISESRLFVSSPPNIDLITAGDRFIEIRWSTPQDDGGSPIQYYNIYRRTEADDLTLYKERIFLNNYTDTDVVYRRTYYYTIRAWNGVGLSSHSDERSDTPQQVPDQVSAFQVKAGEDYVELKWTAPIPGGRMPVTGYAILRGSTPYNMVEISPMDSGSTKYIDYDVEPGVTYYYSILANSDLGPGDPYTAQVVTVPEVHDTGSSYLNYVLLLVLLVVLVAVIVVARKRRAGEVEPSVQDDMYRDDVVVEEKGIAPQQGVTPMVVAPKDEVSLQSYLIEEVLVVYRDGRMITSCAREDCGTEDADLMSGMLIAVQGLIQDGLEGGGTLESIKYGDNLISLATGNQLVLAAVVFGQPDEDLGPMLREKATQIELAYTGVIEEWTGDPSALSGIEGMVQPIIDSTSYLSREDVGAYTAERTVTLLSAIDFHHGYVRLKMAAVNATEETIIDSAIEVHYDTDMLHLEDVKPDSLDLRGDRVKIGNIKPGERKTIALMFDPQICQGTHIDGHLSYYDGTGELRYVEMKRRHADVVCPIFFTAKNANKAMLRRLIKEKLHATDLRVYKYPTALPAYEVLLIAKGALGEEVQLVREYITRGPPYEAEVWYYAQTKVKGYEFVIRLGVMEEKGVLEIFAASTAMEPITGLLAEFRQELNVAYAEGRTGDQRIEVERDEKVRKDLASRPLRLDMPEDDEIVTEDIAEA